MTATAGSPAISTSASAPVTRLRKLLSGGLDVSRAVVRRLMLLPPTRLLIAFSVILLTSSWGVAACFAFRSHSVVMESSRVVFGALVMEEQLQRILALLDRADGAGRAFLLTQRREYLHSFENIARTIPAEMRRLSDLTAGDALHEGDLKQLQGVIGERLELIGSQVKKGTPAGDDSAFVVAMNERGIALMDAIHLFAWRMINAEQIRLANRQEVLSVRARFGSAWLKLFFGVNTVFAGATLLLAVRMNRLQRFAKVCSWSRTIEYEGEWLSFEQYLERKFKIRTSHGISPGEAAKLTGQPPQAFGGAEKTD